MLGRVAWSLGRAYVRCYTVPVRQYQAANRRRRSPTYYQPVAPAVVRPETPEEARAAVAARVEKAYQAYLKRKAHPLRHSMGEAVKVLVGLAIVLTVVLSPVVALILGVVLVAR